MTELSTIEVLKEIVEERAHYLDLGPCDWGYPPRCTCCGSERRSDNTISHREDCPILLAKRLIAEDADHPQNESSAYMWLEKATWRELQKELLALRAAVAALATSKEVTP